MSPDPPPFSVGQRLQLAIQDIAFGGEGVARVADFVVFVPFVLIGEQVEAELTEVKKRFGRARLLRVVQASADRVNPPCPYFGECGGCQYQHMAYLAQLELKHRQITELFRRIGGLESPEISPVIGCPQPYGYRNRIMIRSQWDKFKKGLNIGFIRADSRLVVDILECKIAEPRLNSEITEVRQHPPPKGGIKVMLRVPAEGWSIPKDSFFQNNFHLLPELVRVVRERFAESGNAFLIDTYCGVGFFSIELASLVERFVGVEVDLPAIAAARQNAARRNIRNGEFMVGRAEESLPSLARQFDPARTTILLDPPRTGCPPEILATLGSVRPSQIIYVSCHPATLARDLQQLTEKGPFRLARVVPLDMFPQTQHVECVADIRLRPAEPAQSA